MKSKLPIHCIFKKVARHLTTSKHNKSVLKNSELEQSISEILALQLTELNQLDETGGFGQSGLKELILGQVEHLSGKLKIGFGQQTI
jgi:hypothetical protein